MLRRFLAGLFLSVMITATALIFGLKAPHAHRMFLTEYVGSRVYWVTDNPNEGGGTGFAIKAPSGKTYVVTNDHVCDNSPDDRIVLIEANGQTMHNVRILERSLTSDLCLLEAPRGTEGLVMGPEPTAGKQVYSVGHPDGLPMSVQTGDILGTSTRPVNAGSINETFYKCQAPKFRVALDEKRNRWCLLLIKAYMTNMTILPGNSGSPVVDEFGRVIGVVYAANHDYNWGWIVTHKDLTNLLKNR